MRRGHRELAAMVEDDDSVELDASDDDSHDVDATNPHDHTAATDLSVLEAENASLVEAKRKAEEDRKVLEEQATAFSRQYQLEQAKAEKRLKNLEFNITQKQDLIKSLVRNEQQLQDANHQSHLRIQELEEELEAVRSLPSDVAAEKEAELARLRQTSRVLGSKQDSAKALGALKVEVATMREQQAALQNKVQQDQTNYLAAKDKHQRALVEARRRADRRISELEADNERHKSLLSKKTEELAVATKQLRQARQGSRKTGGGLGEAAEALEKKRRWLEEQVEAHVQRAAATEQLERELRRREEILQDREEATRQLDSLKLKEERGRSEVRESIAGLSRTIATIDTQLRESTQRRGGGQGAADLAGLAQEAEQLERARGEARRDKEALEARAAERQYLDAEDQRTLEALRERVDAMDAEMEYKDGAIAKLQRAVGDAARADMSPESIAKLDEHQARDLLSEYVQRVMALLRLGARRDEENKRLALEAESKRAEVEELANNLKLVELDRDRQLTKQHKEAELKVQMLLKQISSAPRPQLVGSEQEVVLTLEKKLRTLEEQVSLMDKDNFYYKHSNKELKRKLRELVAASEHERYELEAARDENQRLQVANRRLTDHVDNLKARPPPRTTQQHDHGVTAIISS
mmetsp:Transcript_21757/g.51778  ORF Transcript_21757/g.51778 Transcript_21757/m.51778 type:complete len:640 (+) Transcript_21757:262-2181(+)